MKGIRGSLKKILLFAQRQVGSSPTAYSLHVSWKSVARTSSVSSVWTTVTKVCNRNCSWFLLQTCYLSRIVWLPFWR